VRERSKMDTRDAKTTLSPVSGSLHEGQQRGIFLDGKRELDTGSHDASKRLDLLPQDRLQVLHVAGADLEAVAEITRDGVALLDVEQGLDLFEKRTLETRVLEQHVHVRHEGYSDEARIEESREAPDESTRLQLLDPLVDRRRREPDRFRDSRLRDLRVSLENIEDPAIDVVHIKFGLEVRNPNFIWSRGPKQPGRHPRGQSADRKPRLLSGSRRRLPPRRGSACGLPPRRSRSRCGAGSSRRGRR